MIGRWPPTRLSRRISLYLIITSHLHVASLTENQNLFIRLYKLDSVLRRQSMLFYFPKSIHETRAKLSNYIEFQGKTCSCCLVRSQPGRGLAYSWYGVDVFFIRNSDGET